jgi:N-acetylmuramoyl-L-alanine amidase
MAADLFISIYVGGSLTSARREFQTFYFDDGQNLARPGPELMPETDVSGQVEPPRRGVPARPQLVQWDQAQVDFLDSSQMLARMLNSNLRVQLGVEGRGVVGLPILLLRWIRMPAVLVDLGSLHDPGFEVKLREEAYLQRAALGITQAVNDYLALQR